MGTSNDVHKLRVLLPHWIEHNEGHAAEFHAWAPRAGPAGQAILQAAESMQEANRSLEAALEQLGGALERGHHHG